MRNALSNLLHDVSNKQNSISRQVTSISVSSIESKCDEELSGLLGESTFVEKEKLLEEIKTVPQPPASHRNLLLYTDSFTDSKNKTKHQIPVVTLWELDS